MEQTINVNLAGNEVRIGTALELKQPLKINIVGNIDTVKNWIEKKSVRFEDSHILINRDKMSIKLISDEKNYFSDEIEGILQTSKEFKKFEINTGKEFDTWKLAELFKMNRSFFKSKETAMKLVSELNNFVAKIDKEIENKKDDRANLTYKKTQFVKSNIPESFILVLPVIKGQKSEEIEIEIDIEPNNLLCKLVSPQVNDILNSIVNSAIDEQIELIKQLDSNLTIIEI